MSSRLIWNRFQNFSVKLVGIKCSITQKQVSPFCLLCFFNWSGCFCSYRDIVFWVWWCSSSWSDFLGFKLINHTHDGRRGGGTALLVTRDRGATLRWGGGGTTHLFLLTLYNFKNIGGEGGASAPPAPLLRGPCSQRLSSCKKAGRWWEIVFWIFWMGP